MDQIKDKALNIGDKLDYTNAQILEVQNQVNKANKQLKNQNQQLKELVKTVMHLRMIVSIVDRISSPWTSCWL